MALKSRTVIRAPEKRAERDKKQLRIQTKEGGGGRQSLSASRRETAEIAVHN